MYDYFESGFVGALLLVGIMYLLYFWGYAGEPGYIDVYYTVTREISPIFDQIMAAILFALAGGVWGLLFGFAGQPTVFKGFLFGLLPTLWLWLVVTPYMGGEPFGNFERNAILYPLFYNCVIWGSYLGWKTKR